MKLKVCTVGLLVALLAILIAVPLPMVSAAEAPQATPPDGTDDASVEVVNDYYTIIHTTTRDGTALQAGVINGPPAPPDRAAWEASTVSISELGRAANTLANFPSYSWVFGCSAVSGAMIAAYYDNNGYPNMYTGPTNGGVMPQTDTSWGTWSGGRYSNNPLVASHENIDGWVGRGSIDNYWVSEYSTADDPYITNGWSQHAWGTAIGDYMKTSQSVWPYENIDGSTRFWNYSSSDPLTCSTMEVLTASDDTYTINRNDGTYGRKLFYEARGYAVADCYNQPTDNQRVGGFSLAQYQAEINAGHPVFINLAGHSVVGYGYDGNTIYIRDTWDSDPGSLHSMTWGGSYQGMAMQSVSIVHLEEVSSPPGSFGKSSPADGATNQSLSPVLSWGGSIGATGYEYCIDTCSEWVSTGLDTSVRLAGLAGNTTYYWQVRAVNALGTAYADGGEPSGWQFTTYDPALLTKKNFIPLVSN